MKTIVAFLIACGVLQAQAPKKVTLQKFSENDLLVIRTQKGYSTLIEFPADQKILEVTCGDKEFWVVEGSGRFLHVKPAKEGITTNLNVMTEGDTVYTFLLKEISKTGNSKDGPDLRVTVNPGDDVAKLRKDRDNLEEAFARNERALRDLSEKYEAEKKRNPSRDELPRLNQSVPPPKAPVPTTTNPATSDARSTVETKVIHLSSGAKPPVDGEGASAEPPTIASTYVIARKDGLIRVSGHVLGQFFQTVNHILHVY